MSKSTHDHTGVTGARIGIDIGGTKVLMLLLDDSGQERSRIRIATDGMLGAESLTDRITTTIADAGWQAVAIGVGTTGVIKPDTGEILGASNAIRGWRGYHLREILSDKLQVPVNVENDVNAFLYGEVVGRGDVNDALGVMLGTGIGGAVVLDGKLWRGSRGAAMELGHMPGFGNAPCSCGGHGHIDEISSGRGIANHYAQRTGVKLNAGEVAGLARSGNSDAIDVFSDAGRCFAQALMMACTLFDVSDVIVGGSVTRAWDLLEPGLREITQQPLVSGGTLRLLPAQLGDDAVALGAAWLAAV